MASLELRSASSCERRMAIFFRQLREQLREVGRVLLLQQVHQVGGRPHAHEALHGVEHDIKLALGHKEVSGAMSENHSI
jgi:hypothetical protein